MWCCCCIDDVDWVDYCYCCFGVAYLSGAGFCGSLSQLCWKNCCNCYWGLCCCSFWGDVDVVVDYWLLLDCHCYWTPASAMKMNALVVVVVVVADRCRDRSRSDSLMD